MANQKTFDFDWLVIGSGFGGSVSALRLSEKGYSVGVLECGRRFADDEFPSSTADLKRYFWNPTLGMKGIFRLTHVQGRLGRLRLRRRRRQPRLREHAVRPAEGVLRGPPVGGHGATGSRALAPHYAEAQRMLGVVANPHDDPADQLLRELGEELGVGDTYKKTPVGVFFGEAAARPSPTRSSAARGPSAPAVSCAGAAWSAARTAPRTRSSRTTSTSPRSAARA